MKTIFLNISGTNEIIPFVPKVSSIEEYAEKIFINGEKYVILNNFFVNSYFLPAYDYNNGDIKLNIEKAKEVQRNKWRQARKPILEKLDLEFMRALETGDIIKQKQIVEKKQALRDITKIPLSENLEDIKMAWPNILKE